VDEVGVRTLLGRLADTEPPAARIDLAAAIAAGRRGRRWRWLRLGGPVLLAAAAAAVVVAALLTGPAQRPEPQATGGPAAPAQFNVLVPYASFGWLPPGFQEGAAGGTMQRTTPGQLLLIAVSRGPLFEVQVYPTGRCHLAGRALLCSTFDSMNQVLSRAPDVHGHRAYWLRGAGVAWEYAPGAWSVLVGWTDPNVPWPPAGAQRAAVLRVAAGIRYGQTTPIRFPYWFSGLSAAWRVSEVDYTLLAGQPVVQTLRLDGPVAGADPVHVDDLQVLASPAAHSDFSCSPGSGPNVTVDGAVAVVYPATGPAQQLCIPDWRGLRVLVVLTAGQAPPPDPTGPHGVLAYARHLHSLGPDPAHWTTNPLR
jgi:hypothetical protein